MKKIALQNLEMIATEKCNMRCAHCMRGEATSKTMSDEVIDQTFLQTASITNLAIGGGEITLALDTLEKIFTSAVENQVLLDEFGTFVNGTIYDDEFFKLYDYFEEYVRKGSRLTNQETVGYFAVTIDDFHIAEYKRLGIFEEVLENLKKFQESKYFYKFKTGYDRKLFREGYATQLPEEKTVPLRPMKSYITYINKNPKIIERDGLCNIGPMICINVNGTITEGDASFKNQETKYNYGNILTDQLEDVYLKKNAEVVPAKKWIKKTNKEIKKYQTYNR